METETLTCLTCSKSWTRKKARGRKPKFCSDCSLQPEEVKPSIDNQNISLSATYPPPSSWLCEACGAKLEIGVGINLPPTHKCSKRANRILQLTLI
jgi:hypothetical protein